MFEGYLDRQHCNYHKHHQPKVGMVTNRPWWWFMFVTNQMFCYMFVYMNVCSYMVKWSHDWRNSFSFFLKMEWLTANCNVLKMFVCICLHLHPVLIMYWLQQSDRRPISTHPIHRVQQCFNFHFDHIRPNIFSLSGIFDIDF